MNYTLIALDLESTGEFHEIDQIIEMGVVRYDPGRDQPRTVNRRYKPSIPITPESIHVHNITDADVEDCPTFASQAWQIARFLAPGPDVYFIGYNVERFDIPLLDAEFRRAGVVWDRSAVQVIDPMRIFYQHHKRDLASAVQVYLGREHVEAHKALPDAVAALDVLRAQILAHSLPGDMAELYRVQQEQEREADRYVDTGRRFVWRYGQPAFNFTEYRGRLLADVALENPGMMHWLIDRDFPPDVKQIARDALDGVFPKRILK